MKQVLGQKQRVILAARLGMADHALDGGVAPAQTTLDGIDQIVDGAD
jgi:hypothetical protein